jgi:hypothetical protein
MLCDLYGYYVAGHAILANRSLKIMKARKIGLSFYVEI